MNLLIDVPLLWSKDKKEILTKIIERLLDLHALNLVVLANVLLHFVILGKVFYENWYYWEIPIPKDWFIEKVTRYSSLLQLCLETFFMNQSLVQNPVTQKLVIIQIWAPVKIQQLQSD